MKNIFRFAIGQTTLLMINLANTDLHYLIIFIVILVSGGCLDPIDFEVPKGQSDAIAIQGVLIYAEPYSIVEVSITDLFDFDGFPVRPDIREVTIENEQGQSLVLDKSNFKSYNLSILNQDLAITIGKRFRLNVFFLNGTHLQSTFESIHAVSKGSLSIELSDVIIENVDGELSNENEVAVVSTVNLPIDPTTKLKWDIERVYRITNFNEFIPSSDNFFCNNIETSAQVFCDRLRRDQFNALGLLDCDGGGSSNIAECDRGTNPFDKEDDDVRDKQILRSCYIKGFDDVSNLKLVDPSESNTDVIESGNAKVKLFDAYVDYKFAEGYMVYSIAESLSPTAFEYFTQIKEVSELSGGMFDPAPGEIVSNFEDVSEQEQKVFGYFYATQRDTQEIFIDPEVVNRPDTLCPTIVPFETVKRSVSFPAGEPCECFDCTILDQQRQQVSTFRPDFWNEN